MKHSLDIFGPGSNVEHRFIPDHNRLLEIIAGVRQTRHDLKIIMTLGSYDLLHIGHGRYLEQAKERGAVVIVGLDCDGGIQLRKGPHRPIQPQDERIEMLCHLRHVDLVTLDTDFYPAGHPHQGHTQFSLVKLIKPDVFIASERSYDDEQQRIIRENCVSEDGLVVLPSQAVTSTSAQLRKFMMEIGDEAKAAVEERLAKEVPPEMAKTLFGKQICDLIDNLGNIVKGAIDEKMEQLKP